MKLANKKSNELLQIYSLENQSFLNSAPANLKPKSLRDLVGNQDFINCFKNGCKVRDNCCENIEGYNRVTYLEIPKI